MKAAIAPSLTAPAGTKGDVAAELHEDAQIPIAKRQIGNLATL